MKRISKGIIKLNMYKPQKEYFFEKISFDTYKVHLSPMDAANSYESLCRRFEVTPAGNGLLGSAYLVKMV